MKYLRGLADLGDVVEPIVAELAAHPELWNEHTLRTEGYAPAHNAVSDIWVRYRAWDELTHDSSGNPLVVPFVSEPHESVWYPGSDKLPSLRSLVFEICRYFEVERLGGVLITRIPPGGEVKPHIDRGWHAGYYEKIAVQLKSAPGQAFCYDDGQFECEPGTVYTFDNSEKHWVSNQSDRERITAIVCIRRDQRFPPLFRAVGD